MYIYLHSGWSEDNLADLEQSSLLPSSAHPGHIVPNIVYSMGFRFLRICSSGSMLEKRLKELKEEFLVPRGYNPQLFNKLSKESEIFLAKYMK